MKLKKDVSSKIEFQIEVEGSSEEIVPRLVLKNNDMSIMYNGKMQGRNAIFEVSKLDKLFENAKEAVAEIEVIIEGKFFTPWKSTIEFEAPVKVTVTESLQPKIIEPSVKISATHKEVKKQKVIKEGQHKIKVKGKTIDVLVTKVLNENGKTVLTFIDDKGKERTMSTK